MIAYKHHYIDDQKEDCQYNILVLLTKNTMIGNVYDMIDYV